MFNKQNILKNLKQFLLWYAIAIVILMVFIIIITNDFQDSKKFETFIRIIEIFLKNKLTYFVLTIPYLLIIFIKSFIRDYKKQRAIGLLKGIGIKILLPALIISGSFQTINTYRQSEDFNYLWDYSIENKTASIRDLHAIDNKQRGFHIFGWTDYSKAFNTLKTNNVEWITFVPFLSQSNYNKPSLKPGIRKRDTLKRQERWRNAIKKADSFKFKTMLKPHIWLTNTDNGVWRSDINMPNQDDWDLWFKNYSNQILDYAALAESLKMPLFCIGTELYKTVVEQPEKWLQLIADIREIYSGKLIYAANWNQEVFDVPFWDALDFIGIQAYYPIAENENPELEELENGWKKHISSLTKLQKTHNKPIVFTELGYKSTTDAGIKPWEWNSMQNRFHKKISKRTQALCYQAFFNTVWKESWLKGVHFWEWQSRITETDGNNNDFAVQGKPALNIIAKEFRKVID